MPDQTSSESPKRIGPYHIIQVIGEGGMGVVYEAEQKEPVRRRVAIKTMKAGLDTKEVVGRFEAERQALAVMDHPGIAKVFDAGETEAGRPYFVMELVRGIRIDEYSDSYRLTTRERVELFVDVCDAVQHAHLKGVIHRDLKPSNILVTEEQGHLLPKIIDFGVAKATGQRLSHETVVTTFGQALGTLAYMSPEQAEMSGLDVDTRADIYSLGVILYELLLGVVPVDPAEVGAPVFLARLIERDTPTPTPSRRLTSLSEERKAILARHRHTDPDAMRRELRSDLQWIVLKAMDKERARRYETASHLAADLRRFLDDEPVLAHPPSTRYRVRKFVRRNRMPVAMAGGLVVVTLFYAGSLARQFQRVAEERDRAETEAQTAQRVSDFMAELFSVSNPSEARGRTITAVEVLDRGRDRIATELADEPIVQSRLMTVMGTVYLRLGLYQEAEDLLLEAIEAAERGLGPADVRTATSLNQLAWVYLQQQRLDEALELTRRAESIARAEWGDDDVRIAGVLQTIGMIQRNRGEYEEAREALERATELRVEQLGPEHGDVAWSLYHLGWLTYLEGDLLGAREVYERAIAIFEATLDPDDPLITWGYNDMAIVLNDLGEFGEAQAMHERIIAHRERTLGPEHPNLAPALGNLAAVLVRVGEAEAALAHRERALEIRRKAFGPNSTAVATTLSDIGLSLHSMSRYDEALDVYRQALRIHEASGEDRGGLQRVLNNLGYLLRYIGREDEARRHLLRSVELSEAMVGPGHPDQMSALVNLGFLERDLGRNEQAVRYMERAVAIANDRWGEGHVEAAAPVTYLGSILVNLGRAGEALQYLEAADASYVAVDPDHPYRPDTLYEIARAHAVNGATSDRDTTLAQLVGISQRVDGEESVPYADWRMRAAVLQGDREAALRWLEAMIEGGYTDARLLRNFSLADLIGSADFNRLTRSIQESVEGAAEAAQRS